MRKWIFWSFDRGSFQYDVMVGVILMVIFLIPVKVFNDRPDYMRLPEPGEVERVQDDDGLPVYTVGILGSMFVGLFGGEEDVLELEARRMLASFLQSEGSIDIDRAETVYDTWGAVGGFAFWLDPDE